MQKTLADKKKKARYPAGYSLPDDEIFYSSKFLLSCTTDHYHSPL